MKICYLILAHKYPDQLKRLISRLNEPGNSFFIHINKREKEFYQAASEALAEFPNVHFLPRYKIWWGTFGMTKAVIGGIDVIANAGVPYDRVVFISGQDYPIKSNAEIQAFFEKNPDKNYIEFFPLSVANKWTGSVPNPLSIDPGNFDVASRIKKTCLSFRSRVFFLPVPRKAPFGYVTYGGSFWWNLNRECIEYMAAFLAEKREFERFAKYLYLPDEMFFNTLLANSPLRHTLVSDNLRYIDWEKANPQPPAILMMEDFDALKASPALFARKFDKQRDSQILDKIDNELLLNTEVRQNASMSRF
ncbi:MAG TPA: beta-1,6-N-acetylglucosaminyltransferase [Nodosilinea sp.]|nr:beta-1,6-N-acetylglucosaminyltransferase [Nodosilinea sp.]